jgi:hypothetical protein
MLHTIAGKILKSSYFCLIKNLGCYISAAIVVESEEEGHVYKVQRPVYYVSEVLTHSKIWYLHVKNYSTSS